MADMSSKLRGLTAADKERRLALRMELDRTCHAVTQSGLELERFYSHFHSELQQIEEEKRRELQMQLKRKMVELEVSEIVKGDRVIIIYCVIGTHKNIVLYVFS